MYINDYGMFTSLYNWITSSCTNTPIKVKEKSNFFDCESILDYKEEAYTNGINKLIGYNYLYNYIYNMETCINKIDNNFSFSNYNNIYELENYKDRVEDIDLMVFIEWFLEEGILNIVGFIESLESKSYKDEDMYNIMKYYNYLMDNSIKNESDTMLTFLTEGSTEVFYKLNKYTVESVSFSDVLNKVKKDFSVHGNIDLSCSSMDLQGISFKSVFNNIEVSAFDMQASFFYKVEGYT